MWAFQTDKWIWGRPAIMADVLVVASADANVYGLDPTTGRRLWSQPTDNANYSDVVPWKDLSLVACTSGKLYALEPRSGRVA